MAGRYLLDTNLAIALIDGTLDIGHVVSENDQVYVCATVVGELAYGAEHSGLPEANLAKVRGLVEACSLLPQTVETAWEYGRIKAALRRKGRPIPENDLWIAAVATQYGATLVTRDRHFDDVDGLPTERWQAV